MNYTVVDSQGQSAVPLQLQIVVYEAAAVQASILLVSQIDYDGTVARQQARLNTAHLADTSRSTANTAFR